jgi:hypothetical protein
MQLDRLRDGLCPALRWHPGQAHEKDANRSATQAEHELAKFLVGEQLHATDLETG